MDDIKGAIFDLDGTLLDSLSVWEQIDIRFLEKRGITATKEYTQAVTPLGFHKAAEYTIAKYGLAESAEEVIREWNLMAQKAYASEIRLKPNAREYLAHLLDKGVKLGVATALHQESIESVLKNNGIYDMFESFTMLQEVSRGKGFPDIYLLAAQKLSLLPEECVVYEDILTAVKGAKSGGFRVCGVYDSYAGHEWDQIVALSDFTVKDFAELM
ncbi:MAG: HAD family phosphatase [Eubacteriales bacterium]